MAQIWDDWGCCSDDFDKEEGIIRSLSWGFEDSSADEAHCFIGNAGFLADFGEFVERMVGCDFAAEGLELAHLLGIESVGLVLELFQFL